jgi:hypothetical protein
MMATYSTAWAWIITTRPRPKKAFSETEAKKIAEAADIAWSQVKKQRLNADSCG